MNINCTDTMQDSNKNLILFWTRLIKFQLILVAECWWSITKILKKSRIFNLLYSIINNKLSYACQLNKACLVINYPCLYKIVKVHNFVFYSGHGEWRLKLFLCTFFLSISGVLQYKQWSIFKYAMYSWNQWGDWNYQTTEGG